MNKEEYSCLFMYGLHTNANVKTLKKWCEDSLIPYQINWTNYSQVITKWTFETYEDLILFKLTWL